MYLQLAWLQSFVATLGSLYFSEVRHFNPCVLCWYQRICMYPLVALFLVGLWRKDRDVVWYTLPLTVIGLVIALYHNLIYYHLISESFKPCAVGASCTTKFFAWYGFITIPLMSLTAFTIILILTVLYLRVTREMETTKPV